MDALIGFKHFETSTAITEQPKFCLDPGDSICDSYLLDHETNSSDIAFSYGLGAGLALQIHEGERGRVSMVVGARYLFGEEATYVLPSTIQIDETGDVEFETTRSRTDLLTTQIGVVIVF